MLYGEWQAAATWTKANSDEVRGRLAKVQEWVGERGIARVKSAGVSA